MSKLYDLNEIVETTGLPERTVRYYLAKVLEAPGGTPGRKSYYDQVTVDQLMLAQQILMREYDPKRGEVKPTLREFRQWLDSLSEEEIRELVEMPYRIKPKPVSAASMRKPIESMSIERPASKEIDHFEIPSFHSTTSENRKPGKEDKKAAKENAAQYLDRVMAHKPRSARHRPEWKTHRFGPELEIRTRQSLTPEQHRQIQLAGELIQSVLDRGKK